MLQLAGPSEKASRMTDEGSQAKELCSRACVSVYVEAGPHLRGLSIAVSLELGQKDSLTACARTDVLETITVAMMGAADRAHMNMSTSHGSKDSMESMVMEVIFTSSSSTALFSERWRPKNLNEYIGTCVFLVVMAVLFRALMALRNALDSSVWMDTATGHDAMPLLGHEAHEKHSKRSLAGFLASRSSWRLGVDGPRAVLDATNTGVAYLLMLAVMTMNVGYFVSVIVGTFLGSLLIGRFAGAGGSGC